ncbi:uncharacterized protein LOC112569190 [Pomacea canaliculata]|uniref:uncharacterized protein LOC112569190 n=1 Tax=Pomacea canaliculata TaxID=400727 RepID=UPI000D735E73|nr:uncharacterized protein LOC112569190 [Pomacea canaliculata]
MEWRLLLFWIAVLLVNNYQQALEIRECPSGKEDVVEGLNATFTCGVYDRFMTWLLVSRDYGFRYRAICSIDLCYSYLHFFQAAVNASVPGGYQSTLYINNASREQAGDLLCSNRTSPDGALCKLRIVVPAVYTPGSCKIGLSRWWVQGNCTVERMYASDNNYTCTWLVDNNQTFGEFEDGLENYTASNLLVYTRGICSFVSPMPVVPGVYKYSSTISPGPDVYYEDTINIVHPEEPTHTCPEKVFEGSNVTCTCSTSRAGSPPAQTVWDGHSSDTLQLYNVTRRLHEERYTCRLLWGPNGYINRSVIYILNVTDEESHQATSIGGIIGGVMSAVVVITGTVCILVFIIRRRKEAMYDSAIRCTTHEHIYQDFTQREGSVYESMETPNRNDPLYTNVTNNNVNANGGIYIVPSPWAQDPRVYENVHI